MTLIIDPTKLGEMTDQQIIEAYDNILTEEEQILAEKKVLRDEIFARVPNNGGVLGHYTVTKAQKFTPVIPTKKEEKETAMAALKLLGAVKVVTMEKVDNDIIESLYNKGIKLPIEVKITSYPILNEIEQPKNE